MSRRVDILSVALFILVIAVPVVPLLIAWVRVLPFARLSRSRWRHGALPLIVISASCGLFVLGLFYQPAVGPDALRGKAWAGSDRGRTASQMMFQSPSSSSQYRVAAEVTRLYLVGTPAADRWQGGRKKLEPRYLGCYESLRRSLDEPWAGYDMGL